MQHNVQRSSQCFIIILTYSRVREKIFTFYSYVDQVQPNLESRGFVFKVPFMFVFYIIFILCKCLTTQLPNISTVNSIPKRGYGQIRKWKHSIFKCVKTLFYFKVFSDCIIHTCNPMNPFETPIS